MTVSCPRNVHERRGQAITVVVIRGTVRKPRSAGGTWSYRVDLGLDSDGRRAQKTGRRIPNEEGRPGRAQRCRVERAARHLRCTVAPDAHLVPRAVGRGHPNGAGADGVDSVPRHHPALDQAAPRRKAPRRTDADGDQGMARSPARSRWGTRPTAVRSLSAVRPPGPPSGHWPTPSVGTSSRRTPRVVHGHHESGRQR